MIQQEPVVASLEEEEGVEAISVRDLSKNFGSFEAIRKANFDVKRGEIFGLLGPNGAGKTTTMRILSCLIKPSSGSVRVEGMVVSDERRTVEIRRKIGLLTENPNVYERLTAEQNLRFFALTYGLGEDEAERRVSEVLRAFGLSERRKDRAGSFSKGMKQKLAIARALIHKPSVLLLDEPTSALDAESAKSIRELILETSRTYGHSVLLSTHNLDDASRLCDRLAILCRGEIIAKGTEDDIASQLRDSVGEGLDPVKLRVECSDPGAFSVQKLLVNVSGISEARTYRDLHYGYEFSLDGRLGEFERDLVTSKVVSFIVGCGGEVTLVSTLKPSLEEIYMKLVSKKKQEQPA